LFLDAPRFKEAAATEILGVLVVANEAVLLRRRKNVRCLTRFSHFIAFSRRNVINKRIQTPLSRDERRALLAAHPLVQSLQPRCVRASSAAALAARVMASTVFFLPKIITELPSAWPPENVFSPSLSLPE
jgi:hypothetical protein